MGEAELEGQGAKDVGMEMGDSQFIGGPHRRNRLGVRLFQGWGKDSY